jgi:predicted acetyltransferase
MEIETIDQGRSHQRVMRIDGEEVCHLWVIDHTMRIGSAEVRMAGIGDVYTNRAHRMKGYMRQLYGDTLAYMTAEGYDVSMLFGIPNFYTKFGYASSVPHPRVTIKTRDAEAARDADIVRDGDGAGAIASRPIESRDMEAVIALYNRKNADRTGTLVRDPAQFKEFQKGTHWDTQAVSALWEDSAGTLLGYAVWDNRRTDVRIGEVEAERPDLYPTLLAAFAEQAVEKRCEQITLFLPPDHPFAEYAQRFGVVWTIEYPRYADCMMRILNQQPLVEKLLPVLDVRRASLPVRDRPDSLSLETELGITTLRLDGESIQAIEGAQDEANTARVVLPQDRLMQLIMGYRSIQDILTEPDATLEAGTGEAQDVVSLLQGLFPRHNAFVWRPDYF